MLRVRLCINQLLKYAMHAANAKVQAILIFIRLTRQPLSLSSQLMCLAFAICNNCLINQS